MQKQIVDLAYLPMRILAGFFIMGFAIVDLASGQTMAPTPKPSASPRGAVAVSKTDSTLPMYRPVLLGGGPESLINRIDPEDLIRRGQKDAAVMFTCSVKTTGEVAWSGTYRGTPGSKVLEEELQRKLSPATSAKMVPAVYKHRLVDAIYYGTVTFAIVEGKPRLRIFSNQEASELEKESDFIGPQPFFGNESKFEGFHYPLSEDAPVQVSAAVVLWLKIDADGNLQGTKIADEAPPLLHFGEAAEAAIKKARFIPAFREGKPIACEVLLPVYYTPKN